MLCSLPRLRSVEEIWYGCIGRSLRQLSTARASGLDTRRRVTLVSLCEYSNSSIRVQATMSRLVSAAADRYTLRKVRAPGDGPGGGA
jgi:hypothetical protein